MIQTEIFSPGKRDPFLHLLAAVAKKAAVDLRSKDPIEALDSLDWWLCDAHIVLELLGFSINADDIFQKVARQ